MNFPPDPPASLVNDAEQLVGSRFVADLLADKQFRRIAGADQ